MTAIPEMRHERGCLIRSKNHLPLREHLDLPPVFGGVRVAHLFSFLCCVCRFVCLRSNVARVS